MFSPHPSYMNSQETKREWSLRSRICFIHCNWIATQNAVTRQEKESLGDIWLHRHVLRDILWISGQIASSSDKGFSTFSSWLVAEAFRQLATWLWFSDTTSFFEKHSENLQCCWLWHPVGKPVSAKEEEAMFIICNNWVALCQQEMKSKGHICSCSAPYSEWAPRIPRTQLLLWPCAAGSLLVFRGLFFKLFCWPQFTSVSPRVGGWSIN